MEDLRWASAATQCAALERGEVSGAELRDAAISRCEALDGDLHFLVASLGERAPAGVPMLLKDAGQEIADTPHYVGLAVLRDAGHRSTVTTGLAARLETRGFSVIGKSACPPFASGITTEPPGFEPTRNPWDPSRSPGGSSGGSAAAVAAGAVSVAHGSDATGSLRCPAALCGLVTLNPTGGLLPVVPPAGQPGNRAWRDFVLARHAADLRLVLERLTGEAVTAAAVPLRVGILDHDPELGLPVHAACRDAVAVVARLLERLGHDVQERWPSPLGRLWASCSEAFAVVSDATRPPMIAWVGERLGRPVEAHELDADVVEAAARAASRSAEEVRRAQRAVDAAVAPIEDWWRDHDILVTPTTFQPAWRLGGDPGPRELGTLCAPFSLTGQPAVSVPAGFTDEGLPVGVQLVGRRGDDAVLLQLAEALEETLGWTARRPQLTG